MLNGFSWLTTPMIRTILVMTFDKFVDQAWTDHKDQSTAVAHRLREFIPMVSTQDQIPPLVSLVTHVFGEHLGQWSDGIELLQRLQSQADSAEHRHTVYRSIAALRLAGGMADNVDDLLNSDQIRVLCVAASAVNGHGQFDRAIAYFSEALKLTADGLKNDDPALRSLAVTGNNLAAELETRKSRSTLETDFMVRAARAGLKYWLLVGDWNQHQAAHFRLSKSLLAASYFGEALEEAMSCLALCKANAASAYDLFWANEAVASVIHGSKPSVFAEHLDRMRDYFKQLSPSDQPWCEPRLKEMENI